MQYAHPADVLAKMHWQESQDAGGATLPNGVVRIFALQSRNILLLQATDAGYKQVQEIVKALDVAPQQVRTTVRFAAVPLDQKVLLDLSNPSQALLQLHSANALFSEPTLETADNGKPADFSLPWLHLDKLPGITPSKSPELRLIPRINANGTVEVGLDAEEPTAQVLKVFRTVPSGGTTVYDATPFLPPSKYQVFLFVTPTLAGNDASAGANDGTMNSKP